MPWLIDATFPGRPGLRLIAEALPTGTDSEPSAHDIYWVRLEVDGHIVWEIWPKSREQACVIAGGVAIRMMAGCSIEGLSEPGQQLSKEAPAFAGV